MIRLATVFCLVVLLGGMLLPAAAAAQDAVATPASPTMAVAPNDCEFLIQGSDDPRPRLGEITCGTLDVPENWDLPDGRQIPLAYLILKSTSAQPHPDPVVFLSGGPGLSALTTAEPWANVFTALRQDRDIVLFDQRGTRLSSPLRCEAHSQALAIDAAPEEGSSPSPAYPADVTDPDELLQAAREQYGPIARACVEEILATGVDLRQYNSIASANDVVALVQALGYDTYNLYGVSYGTRLALEVMRTHAGSGLRSVVLDSVYPPEVKSYEEFPQEPHQVVIQLFADCARNTACNTAYPNLKARFIDLLTRLRAEPIVAADGTAISDRDVIALMQTLGSDIPAVPYVPLMIAELERGETATFQGIASGDLFLQAEDAPDSGATPQAVGAAEATPNVMATLSPARRFVVQLQAALAGRSASDGGSPVPALLELEAQPHQRETLQAFIDRTFTEPAQAKVQAEFLSTVAAMSEADVVEAFAVIDQTITLIDMKAAGQTVPQYYTVECNERAPFQEFANMVTNAQHLEIPDLALNIPQSFAKVFAICEEWPAGQAPASAEEPVWSDVPTLILAGAYDNLTPVSWTKSAFVTLPNGVFVLAPMAGHGVIVYSDCAQQVGRAFVDDPTAALDTSCFADLQPQWVLPAS